MTFFKPSLFLSTIEFFVLSARSFIAFPPRFTVTRRVPPFTATSLSLPVFFFSSQVASEFPLAFFLSFYISPPSLVFFFRSCRLVVSPSTPPFPLFRNPHDFVAGDISHVPLLFFPRRYNLFLTESSFFFRVYSRSFPPTVLLSLWSVDFFQFFGFRSLWFPLRRYSRAIALFARGPSWAATMRWLFQGCRTQLVGVRSCLPFFCPFLIRPFFPRASLSIPHQALPRFVPLLF